MFRRAVFVVFCGFAPVAFAQLQLETIRDGWRARRYPETYEATEQYRKAPYGKQLEVYYMGGTSLCRIPGRADRGAVYMQWILDNFWLTPQAGETVQKELETCRTASAVPPLVIAFNGTLATAGSSGRTKMYYFTGGNNALKSEPVTVVKEIPEEELRKRLFAPGDAERAKAAVAGLAGGGDVAASSHFVVASAMHDAGQLRAIGERLDAVYDFFVAEYSMRPPDHLISVYLTPDERALQARSVALHGIQLSPQSIGYSYQADMSMIGIVPGQEIGTLQHELFHLMVRNNFGDIPPWLDEGMAALYEVSRRSGRRILGAPNWRGPVLDQLWELQPPAEALVRMNWLQLNSGDRSFQTERQAANHAKARYLVMYLQEEGKLRDVYRAFQAREIGTDSVALLGQTLRTDMTALEAGFQAWFKRTLR